MKEDIKYVGDIELPQYYVQGVQMEDKYQVDYFTLPGDGYGVRVQIILGRNILNQLLTTYIPTMCICLVAFSTNFLRVGIYWMSRDMYLVKFASLLL